MNSSMIDSRPIRGDIEIFEVPANDLAKKLGNDRLTNMVMLGAYLEKTGLAPVEVAQKAVEEIFKGKGRVVVAQNKKALRVGYDYMSS